MNRIYKYTMLLGILLLGHLVTAQKGESISVPLSEPGQAGTLLLYNHNGPVAIEGYNGNTVEVFVTSKGSKSYNKKKNKRDGLKVIPRNALGVSIVEDNNEVHISSTSNEKKSYKIRVPRDFSLQIGTHHDGDIYVKNVVGVLECNAHHSSIILENVGGSVIADTHHGEIEVTMTEIHKEEPMAFTTYHGDIEITFPTNIGAILKMKSGKGEIYTDYEIEMFDQEVERSNDRGIKKIKLGGWTKGRVGDGGPQLLMDTYHGDIIIRKG